MRKLHQLLLASLGFLLVATSFAEQTPVAAQIDQLIQKMDPNVLIGIEILDLNSNQILYEKNANQYFTPASNIKLITSAAALLYLGPDFRFNTALLTDAEKVQDHVLQGNLYLKLSGDPTLTESDLKQLLQQLSNHSIKTIQGNLVIETPTYDGSPYAPGTMLEDTPYYYAAKNTPLILNQNVITVTVNPASQINGSAYISITPTTVPIAIHNQLITAAPEEKKCSIQYKMDNNNDLWVSGCIPQQSMADTEYLAIQNPLLYAQVMLKNLLKEASIQLNGKILTDTTPATAKMIASHPSIQLFDIVYETLKNSNNIFADALFLKLGELFEGKPSNWQKGTHAVKKILFEDAGVSIFASKITDGSGVSSNLVTPHQIVSLLSAMTHQFNASYEFIAGLPMNSSYGSLQERMVNKENDRFVRAKTGTMSDTTALSGYLETADNKLLIFSIMINHTVKSSDKYKKLEDEICTYLANTKIGNLSAKPSPKQAENLTKKITYTNSIESKKKILNSAETDLRKNLINTRISVIRNENSLMLIVPSVSDQTLSELSKIAAILKPFSNSLITIVAKNKDSIDASKILELLTHDGIDKNKILIVSENSALPEPIRIILS
ncbi:MAG: D-alanyl-D-alanine carboxypeptidase/D-alanyl-D-alanine-endopeptidase [Proteobacteria bacterium]|nr:D-alanyl-D-alanine carboxypeptidase/D-alanyl-D-alanine-endopeptidase [Pseudomonadota bacterium]